MQLVVENVRQAHRPQPQGQRDEGQGAVGSGVAVLMVRRAGRMIVDHLVRTPLADRQDSEVMTRQVSESALVAGTPEEVWPLVTDPVHFQRWYSFGGAAIDLRPGGAISMQWPEHGTFDAIVESVRPGEVFSFRWLPAPGPLVEISLRGDERRTTRVQITESGDLENPEQSAIAWRNALRLLGELAQARRA